VVHTSRPVNDVPNQLNARHSLDDIVAKLSNTNTREPDVEQEAHARSPSDNALGGVERNVPATTPNDFLSALLAQDRRCKLATFHYIIGYRGIVL
jgi:hypothetical protein